MGERLCEADASERCGLREDGGGCLVGAGGARGARVRLRGRRAALRGCAEEGTSAEGAAQTAPRGAGGERDGGLNENEAAQGSLGHCGAQVRRRLGGCGCGCGCCCGCGKERKADDVENFARHARRWAELYASASDVAAICGYNPWTSLSDLFIKYLYQGQEDELERDSKAAGVAVETADQALRRLIGQTRAEHRKDLRRILADAASAARSATVEQVAQQKIDIENTLVAVRRADSLDADSLKQLRELLRYEVCTQFGTRHENAALEQYSRHFGWDVTTPDDLFKVKLPIECLGKYCDVTSCPERGKVCAGTSACLACTDGRACRRACDCECDCECNCECECECDGAAASGELWICGRVDGLAHVAVSFENDLDTYVTERVVLEVKNRTSAKLIEREPGFHEIVQLIVYLKLLGCARGELVQAFRERPGDAPTIRVRPVAMDAEHSAGWDEEIVPKLLHFAHILLRARAPASRDLRLSLLRSSVAHRAQFLRDTCPWLCFAAD